MKQGKLAVIAVACLFTGSAPGAGFQLYTEGSAEALGQAGAVSGRTNLVSLAWYNPAALAGTGRPAVMLGSTFASIHTDYKNAFSSAADAGMSDEWRLIPHLYYVQPLAEDWTGTLSVNAPYGLITEWPADWAGAPLAVYSDLQAVYITPSVAWRPAKPFSVSVGVNVVRAKAELTRMSPVPPVGEVKVEGDNLAYGYTFSAHYQPLPDWGIGARYQSRVKVDIQGDLTTSAGTLPASAEVELPSSVNFGVANTTIKNLALGFDVVWTEWSTYDSLVIEAPPLPPTVSAKDWDDVLSIRFGGEYALGESWRLRAGYVWDQSPVPDTTRAPELPGSDRQMLMAGVGWKWEGISIDAAYSYLWAETAKMGSDISGAFPALAGEFETTTQLASLSVGYTF